MAQPRRPTRRGCSWSTTSRRSCARSKSCCARPASRSCPPKPPPRRSTSLRCVRRRPRSSTGAAGSRRRGADAQAARVERDADPGALGGGRGGAEGAGAGGGGGRLHHQAVRHARARGRLQAALRRAARAEEEPSIAFDGLEVDLAGRVVRRDGEPVHLTPIEFDLLRVLVRNRGRLMTHRKLLTEVWGPEYVDDISRCAPTSRACARRSSRMASRDRATSSPTRVSATASPAESGFKAKRPADSAVYPRLKLGGLPIRGAVTAT
jgi:hypothetical protein